MKKFMCFWGVGYNATGEVGLRGTDDFREDYGYTEDDICKIATLDVGWTEDLSTPSGTHFVTRVE